MIEGELLETEKVVVVSFMLIHPDRPDFRPIIENWPIPRVGEYVSLSTPSPFAGDEYVHMTGRVKAIKHDFYDQELPNGERVSRNMAIVLLEDGLFPFEL